MNSEEFRTANGISQYNVVPQLPLNEIGNSSLCNEDNCFRERLNAPLIPDGPVLNFPSSPDDSFTDTEEIMSPTTLTENEHLFSNSVSRKVSFDETKLQEPIYEEVADEEIFTISENIVTEIDDNFDPTAPMYENISNVKATESDVFTHRLAHSNETDENSSINLKFGKKPTAVTKKLLDNQAKINDLMNELTTQMVKQRSKKSLYDVDNSEKENNVK